jgi:hypothetical protein
MHNISAACWKRLLATHGPLGIIRELASMPDAYDPYRLRSDAIEEAVRLHQHLAVRKIRELRERMTGLRNVA